MRKDIVGEGENLKIGSPFGIVVLSCDITCTTKAECEARSCGMFVLSALKAFALPSSQWSLANANGLNAMTCLLKSKIMQGNKRENQDPACYIRCQLSIPNSYLVAK